MEKIIVVAIALLILGCQIEKTEKQRQAEEWQNRQETFLEQIKLSKYGDKFPDPPIGSTLWSIVESNQDITKYKVIGWGKGTYVTVKNGRIVGIWRN